MGSEGHAWLGPWPCDFSMREWDVQELGELRGGVKKGGEIGGVGAKGGWWGGLQR